MRRKIVAGNWKMNKTLTDSVALAKDLKAAMADMPVCGVEMVVAPVFTNISAVAQELKGTGVAVAAQNIYPKASGAYTGEVSAPIAKSAGASKVILGHSERRQYFGETDQFLAEKTDAALAENMEVIFCIGEVLEQRKSGEHFKVVEDQIKNALFHLPASAWSNIVSQAYEPVWAIGTGRNGYSGTGSTDACPHTRGDSVEVRQGTGRRSIYTLRRFVQSFQCRFAVCETGCEQEDL